MSIPAAAGGTPTAREEVVMACTWREQNGLRYLYADYRDQTHEQHMATLAESVTLIEAAGPGVRVLVHVDGRNRPTSEFLAATKSAVRGTFVAHQVRTAFVGIDGFGRVVLRGLQLVGGGIGAPAFPTEEKALAYLARP